VRRSSKANSDNKTHYGLGVSRSEERGVECKRDWNKEEGYLPSLNEPISAVTQLTAGPMLDESRSFGSLKAVEVATQLNQWFHFADK